MRETAVVRRAGQALVASALACAIATTPTAAEAATPGEASIRATLTIDTSEIGSAGPIVRERLLERGGKVFRDGGVLSGTGASDPEVVVHVQELTGDEPGFSFEISIRDRDRASGKHQWDVDCKLCTESELIDAVAGELDKVVTSLTTLRAEPPPEPEPADPVPDPTQPPDDPPPDDDRGRLHVLTKAGIGTLVVGALAAGAGLGLVLAPPQVLPDDPTQERYTQPPGFAVLAVGGAALIAGAVLVGIGVKRSNAAKRVALGPYGVTVRF